MMNFMKYHFITNENIRSHHISTKDYSFIRNKQLIGYLKDIAKDSGVY